MSPSMTIKRNLLLTQWQVSMCTQQVLHAAYNRKSILRGHLLCGVDVSTHFPAPGAVWHIQPVQYPSLMAYRSSWRGYIGCMVMFQGSCCKCLTTISTLPHWVTILTPLSEIYWRCASLTSIPLEKPEKIDRVKSELLRWSSRMRPFQVDLSGHI